MVAWRISACQQRAAEQSPGGGCQDLDSSLPELESEAVALLCTGLDAVPSLEDAGAKPADGFTSGCWPVVGYVCGITHCGNGGLKRLSKTEGPDQC